MNIKELFVFLSGLPDHAILTPGFRCDKTAPSRFRLVATVGETKAGALKALEEYVHSTPPGTTTELDVAFLSYLPADSQSNIEDTVAITPSTFEFHGVDGGEMYLLEGGKYCVENKHGVLKACRYGEVWRDLSGDGLVLALVHEIERRTMRCNTFTCPTPPDWRLKATGDASSMVLSVSHGNDDVEHRFALRPSGPNIAIDVVTPDVGPRTAFEEWYATTKSWRVGCFRRLSNDTRYESLEVEASFQGFLQGRYGATL